VAVQTAAGVVAEVVVAEVAAAAGVVAEVVVAEVVVTEGPHNKHLPFQR
jgi:hypothetical protein